MEQNQARQASLVQRLRLTTLQRVSDATAEASRDVTEGAGMVGTSDISVPGLDGDLGPRRQSEGFVDVSRSGTYCPTSEAFVRGQ